MANLRDIRRRIKGVKSTAQITKAMELVAASKMKKAQNQALAGRPYAELMNRVLAQLKGTGDGDENTSHPLLEDRPVKKELLLLVTSDKGLCGAMNTNLIKEAMGTTEESTVFVTIGKKGNQQVARLQKDLLADFPIADPVPFSEVKRIGKFIVEQFESGEVDRVRIAFTDFVNTLTQKPRIEQLLPINASDLGEAKDYESMGSNDEGPKSGSVDGTEYLFEPDPMAVFDTALPLYVYYGIYQVILESRASEHSARMVAMKGATDNANQLSKDLTLEYNKVRQAAITNELLEITTAMKALE